MIHSTLVTLKDLASQQRDRLHAAQELLATQRPQGIVEVEVTQELLCERAFMEQLQSVLEAASKETVMGSDYELNFSRHPNHL